MVLIELQIDTHLHLQHESSTKRKMNQKESEWEFSAQEKA